MSPIRKPLNYLWPFFLIINLILAYYLIFGNSTQPKVITWNYFSKTMLADHDVKKLIVINREKVDVYLKREALTKTKYQELKKAPFGKTNEGPHYEFMIGSLDLFEKRMEDERIQLKEEIEIEYKSESGWWGPLLNWLVPFILLFFLVRILFTRFSGGISGGEGRNLFDFGKSTPQVYDKERMSQITFKDVAGYEEAKTEIMEVVEFLKSPEQFTKLGAHIPKGILLIGAPGTGKTLMAKAVAGEAGVPFFSLSGSAFMEMFVGIGASRVRDLFQKAKQRAPSIVFIDEIDAIGRARGKALSVQSNEERDTTLNQLLAEMDGFGPQTSVIVLAATNRADVLDPALLRPGRFDRHVYLDLPNLRERTAIFEVHLQKIKTGDLVKAQKLAELTPSFSGADIANLCNEAALIAARKKSDLIQMKEFNAALDRIIGGLEKKSMVLSENERRIIAYHEAGHTLISWMLPHLDPIEKVTIIPRGQSLGGSWFRPEERQLYTKTALFERLCAALAGRCAEELIFGDITSGALDDLEKATKQAYIMVSQLGFSPKLENISYYDSAGTYENSLTKPFSESTSKLIDEEVRMLLAEAKTKNMEILKLERLKLGVLAELLLKKEEVYQNELIEILGNRVEKTNKLSKNIAV